MNFGTFGIEYAKEKFFLTMCSVDEQMKSRMVSNMLALLQAVWIINGTGHVLTTCHSG